MNSDDELKLKAFELSINLKNDNDDIDKIINRAEKIYQYIKKQNNEFNYPSINTSPPLI